MVKIDYDDNNWMKQMINEIKNFKFHPIKTLNERNDKSDVFTNPYYDYFEKEFIYDNKLINEGLTRTHPLDKTIEILKRRFNLHDDEYEIYQHNGINVLFLIVNNTEEDINYITKIMDFFGYFKATKNDSIIDGNKIRIKFEPKFENETDNFIGSLQFYHVTPIYNLEKILKIGLTPKSKNTKLEYPDRIYLIHGGIDDKLLNAFCKMLANKNPNTTHNGEYAILSIDRTQLKDVKVYDDPNTPFSFYTCDNIPPNAIKLYKTVNL